MAHRVTLHCRVRHGGSSLFGGGRRRHGVRLTNQHQRRASHLCRLGHWPEHGQNQSNAGSHFIGNPRRHQRGIAVVGIMTGHGGQLTGLAGRRQHARSETQHAAGHIPEAQARHFHGLPCPRITHYLHHRGQTIHHRTLGNDTGHIRLPGRHSRNQTTGKRRSPQHDTLVVHVLLLTHTGQRRLPVRHFPVGQQHLAGHALTLTEVPVVKQKHRMAGVQKSIPEWRQPTVLGKTKTVAHDHSQEGTVALRQIKIPAAGLAIADKSQFTHCAHGNSLLVCRIANLSTPTVGASLAARKAVARYEEREAKPAFPGLSNLILETRFSPLDTPVIAPPTRTAQSPTFPAISIMIPALTRRSPGR